MLISRHIGRILFCSALLFVIAASSASGQTTNKSNFIVPQSLYSSYPWVLSAIAPDETAITSEFYPLLPQKLSGAQFEQVQSVIIPGGIADIKNNAVYLEDTDNDIVMLDINTGKTIQQINGVCCPIAVVDNCLVALSRTGNQPSSYSLFMFDENHSSVIKTRWSLTTLPEWLDLPADGERQKFVFSVHCYSWLLSTGWQASKRAMFPNPLSLVIASMAQPAAEQGSFSVDLKSPTVVSQSMQASDAGFLGYLTANESTVPAEIVLHPNTIAIQTIDPYLFSLIRAYPPKDNIAKSGVVAQRELQVKDMHTDTILWAHTLPAAFIPLPF